MDIEARIMARGSETPETMGRRLETARIEMAARTEFDLVVINDEVKRTCDELVSLLVGPSSRTTRAR